MDKFAVYEECDRGLLEVNIQVTPAPQCIVMEILLTIVAAAGSEYAIRGLYWRESVHTNPRHCNFFEDVRR